MIILPHIIVDKGVTMSKPQVVVLGFLKRQPMYGYQIGQIVEDMKMPIWAGIKLPSIYKALQSLEEKGFIRGEQVTEGNNPPRTVFHITDDGRKQLRKMVKDSLMDPRMMPQEWWLVLSFTWGAISREDLSQAIELRLERLKNVKDKKKQEMCQKLIDKGELPCIMRHIMGLGRRQHEMEIETLSQLYKDIQSEEFDKFFEDKGESK